MYVTVATYNNPVEAHISRGLMEPTKPRLRLESEGMMRFNHWEQMG